MSRSIISLLILLFVLSAAADGPPIDTNGSVQSSHFSIDLTDEQIIFLESHRNIVLEDYQKKYFDTANRIHTIQVLTQFYNDCTCGMYYAIWSGPKELTVLGDSTAVEPLEHNDIDTADYMLGSNAYYLNFQPEEQKFYIGMDGEIYYKGKPASLDRLQKMLNRTYKKHTNWIMVYLPVKKGNPNWERVESSKALIESLKTNNTNMIIYS